MALASNNRLDHWRAGRHRLPMRSLSTILATVSLSASAAASPATPRTPPRHASAEAAVRAYFTGSDRCSARDLRGAFHPAAHLQSVDDHGAARSLDQLTWWTRTGATRPCVPAEKRTLKELDREGPLALVEATSRYAGFQFHDLLLVAETPDGWLIVDKVFERLGSGEAPRAADGAEAAIRAVIDQKAKAHHELDPALLARSHLGDAVYTQVGPGAAVKRLSVSEWAAVYASRRDRGENSRADRWRILKVWSAGRIAAVKTDLVSKTGRHVDHLLLLRTTDGWRIAAATWGALAE
jgi:hypothetical protein